MDYYPIFPKSEILDEDVDEQEFIRIIESMPYWEPATLNGEKVRTNRLLPIKFDIDNSATSKSENKHLLVMVDPSMERFVNSRFNGGMEELTKFLKIVREKGLTS